MCDLWEKNHSEDISRNPTYTSTPNLTEQHGRTKGLVPFFPLKAKHFKD